MRFSLLPLFLLVAPVLGQDFLVAKHLPARLSLHDGTNGNLLNDTFMDIDALLGLGGGTSFAWEAVVPGNGEIWVTNFSTQAVHRFTDDGLTYLGDFPTSRGGALGASIANNTVWVCAQSGPFGAGIIHFDDTAPFAMTGSTATSGPYDTFVYQNEVLVSHAGGNIERLDPTTGLFVGTFASPGGFLEQMAEASNGNLLVANFSGQSVLELDPSGSLVNLYPITGAGSVRGVAELGNGMLLVSGSSGVVVVDPNTGASTSVNPGSGAFVVADSGMGPGNIGQNYCGPAIPNSTGQPGEIDATGSNVVADNNVTLIASQLPANIFGYFLNSQTQAFVFPVPNSQGALCLGGQIGRYNTQVQNSGAMGTFMIQLNLASTPTPSGPVAIMAGQRWNFTCWYRDANPGPTSNFTDGYNITFQ